MDQTPASPPPQAEVMQAPDYDEKFFAALGYLGFLFLLTLIVKPKSAYCKFHAKQSFVLFVGALISIVVLALIRSVGSILTLALFAIYVLAIYRAYRGDWWSIPFVSAWAGKVDLQAVAQKAGLAVSNLSGLKEAATGLAEKAGQVADKITDQSEQPSSSQQEKGQASGEQKS